MKKEKFIRLTKQAISDMFDECNQAYFGNAIPRPKQFELWTPHRKIVGMVRPLYNKRTDTYSSALHISRIFNWTEENFRKTVVHEMIHLYIGDYLRPLKWYERIFPFLSGIQHDEEFKRVMNDLNERYDLGVAIRFKEMKNYYKPKKRK